MTITLTREEAQQVLDALIWTTGSQDFSETGKARVGAIKVLFPAIETLRARLAQPEPKIYSDIDEMFRDMGVPVTEPKPVAWMHPEWNTYTRAPAMSITPKEDWIPLYTAPPQRSWQGLTDDEIYEMYSEPCSDAEMVQFARAIEAKLKEKNNG